LLQTKNASEKIGIQSRNLIIAPIIAFASQPAIDRARKETPPENRSRAVRPRGNNHLSFFLLHRIPFGSTPASLLLFILETLFYLLVFFYFFCFLCVLLCFCGFLLLTIYLPTPLFTAPCCLPPDTRTRCSSESAAVYRISVPSSSSLLSENSTHPCSPLGF
jgi:hypothetical protein